jgi:hypothetical protein
MISGFSSTPRHSHGGYDSNHSGVLPVPFNIPNVLHNLLFEDVGLEFDSKQSDILETLRFSQAALVRMQQKYALKEQELVAKMLRDSDNQKYKEEYEEMQLDRFEANSYFKELVVVISDLLTREQYAKLLEFSNIPH